MIVSVATLMIAAACWTAAGVDTAATFDLQTAVLTIDSKGYSSLQIKGAPAPWPSTERPIMQVLGKDEVLSPDSVTLNGDKLAIVFAGGGSCELTVRPGNGFAVFEMTRFECPGNVQQLRLFSLGIPKDADILRPLNACALPTHVVALSGAEPNVSAFDTIFGRNDSDRAGCTHQISPADQPRAGNGAGRFTATCDAKPSGWAVFGRDFPQPRDLSGLKAIRAWVKGDAKGEILKIQLSDGVGGYRDSLVPIGFDGWQWVTVSDASLNTLRNNRVANLSIYYNGIPAGQTVSCDIDQIEAILERDGKEEAVVLEEFEPDSPFWREPAPALNVATLSAHGLQPARFGIVAASRENFLETMARFEEAAGLPSPRPGGVWNKQSPWVKQSYLFITSFKESQFDAVTALAHRGGFGMILMGQESWTKSTGHYEINTDNFPGGLEALSQTFRRFREAGFHVGLHLLAASIYPPDAYLAPVPDPRLVRDASVTLASDIDEKAVVIPAESSPVKFPAEDGGYMGSGTVVQIDNELLAYGSRTTDAPFAFKECSRGLFGTAAAPHAKGQAIRHLRRSYGYFLHDMDTTLTDEVASNFAKVANACDVDMLYFDGSEALQDEHWYYNAKLHKSFFDKLARKDVLIQASSYSHYSWHMLARSASADGHGDLKGYLDERSPGFESLSRNAMPLDIGWYYGYDPTCTPDMYEYILGASIGYDSSISFQVSLDAASSHPFTGEILDLISRYEQLRLSGKVPAAMRERLRIDPALGGTKTPEEREGLSSLRREYRLVKADGADAFQRVDYTPWRQIDSADPQSCSWQVHAQAGPAKTGVQLHVQPGVWLDSAPSYRAKEAVTLESFDDLDPYLNDPRGQSDVRDISNGQAGATLAGTSQHISLSEEDGKEGGRYAVYSAENSLDAAGGWSVFGKAFDPPLDLTWHKAIGFWLRGDGKGGAFKVQLLDGARAADFYVSNDYTGWRYQQIPRPEPDPIDYSKVCRLNFYYNGLPAKTTVTCGIDDLRALPALDVQTLFDPWIEIAGRRIAWKGTLTAGQYLFLWPGETPKVYGPRFSEPVAGPDVTQSFALPAGDYEVKFGHEGPLTSPLRARVTFQPPECHTF